MKSTINSNITTNGTGSITGSIVNSDLTDMVDSALFIEDFEVKVSVSSAEILAIYTTPKQLVAAPGAGKVILPLNLFALFDYNSVAYATNTTLSVGLDGATAGTLAVIHSFGGYLNQASDQQFYVFPNTSGLVSGLTSLTNKNICLSTLTGNPTAGNSTLVVYLRYRTITL